MVGVVHGKFISCGTKNRKRGEGKGERGKEKREKGKKGKREKGKREKGKKGKREKGKKGMCMAQITRVVLKWRSTWRPL